MFEMLSRSSVYGCDANGFGAPGCAGNPDVIDSVALPSTCPGVDSVAGSAAAVDPRAVDATAGRRYAAARRDRRARRQRCEFAALLHRRKGEVVIVTLAGDDAAVHLIRSGRTGIERAVVTQRKRRADDPARRSCTTAPLAPACHRIRIRARRIRATSQHRRLRKELHTEAPSTRRRCPACEFRLASVVPCRRQTSILQHIRLHRLDADARALGRQVQRRACRAARGERRIRRTGCTGNIRVRRRRMRSVVGSAAGVRELVAGVRAGLVLIDPLCARGRLCLRVAWRRSTAGHPSSHDTVDRDRTGTGDGAVGMQREHERLRCGLDDQRGVAVGEVKLVALLIGRQERAVDQHTAVDEVESPVACADEDASHRGPRSRLRIHGAAARAFA